MPPNHPPFGSGSLATIITREEPESDEEDRGEENQDKGRERTLLRKLGFSFFLFGLINNVLYVIILSAALDLVPPATPKGIIAFCNIAPSLFAKISWPYLLKGRIRYTKRLLGCCLLSTLGMLVVALFDSLYMRLLGIGLASFSSGLGELTFLQLSTTYAPPPVAGHSVGYFASGTGAAGLVGAFLWWELRGLGVRTGVGLSSVMPCIIPITYFFLLPNPSMFLYAVTPAFEDTMDPSAPAISTLPYTPLATAEDEDGEEEGTLPSGPKRGIALSASDKWRLAKPLLTKYMLPLFCVYLVRSFPNNRVLELIDDDRKGISPTLLYPVPTSEGHWLLSKIIHSVRDYYPLWQLVYQATVFLSRSSISLGLPALPTQLLPLPAIIQFILLLLLGYESAVGFFGDERESMSVFLVFLLVSLEGICGGLAYVNVFYRINHEPPDPTTNNDIEQTRQEREFKIGSIGFSDGTGILLASILAVPTEIELCKAQVGRGKLLCKGL
ncbi:Protein BTN1 [Psilocybe cubensis]|uniref:Protein BTN1 n=2 Tax=Psilocybe cubensis TaxID=181762 RepID=A0ACB8GGB7_PSICU|nr:Protein BTN1 [Psilocybe cubensis]KAH9474723.1 Protein BTN1 [Psilocybe cubensis]